MFFPLSSILSLRAKGWEVTFKKTSVEEASRWRKKGAASPWKKKRVPSGNVTGEDAGF